MIYNSIIGIAHEWRVKPVKIQRDSEKQLCSRITIFSAFPRYYGRFLSSRIVSLLLLHDSLNFVQTFNFISWLFLHDYRWSGNKRKNQVLFSSLFFVKLMKMHCEYSVKSIDYLEPKKNIFRLKRISKKKKFYQKGLYVTI